MISVIIPVYNAMNFLDACVNSVISQDYTNIEIMLINDGSTDNSAEICDNWAKKDSRIRVIHKENGGVSSARNAGINGATGEFLIFLDSDDTLKPGVLKKMRDAMTTDVSVCIGGFEFIYDDYTLLAKTNINGTFSKAQFFSECFETLYGKSIISAPTNKLYRKKTVLDNKLNFSEQLVIYEDFLFAIEYLNKSEKISLIDTEIYNYLQTNMQSALSKYQARFTDNSVEYINRISELLPREMLPKICYGVIMRAFNQEYKLVGLHVNTEVTFPRSAKSQITSNFSKLRECLKPISYFKLLTDLKTNKNIKLVCSLLRFKCYDLLFKYGLKKHK